MSITDPRAWLAEALGVADRRKVPHTGPGHAAGDPAWCEGCNAELTDVGPSDWFSKDELVGMLEHHGADPDRIDADATLMHLAPDMAAALTAVLDLHSADEDGDCAECIRRAQGRGDQSYPCPTVRAITENLGGDRG